MYYETRGSELGADLPGAAGRIPADQCALDVLALDDPLGLGRFKAIGLSLGAKTLLHVATQQPAHVEAMVLVSAAPNGGHGPIFGDAARFRESALRFLRGEWEGG